MKNYLKNLSNLNKKALIAALFTTSCALSNPKEVLLPIASNPPGADLYIDGQYYGQTPKTIRLEPSKTYTATLVKDGYGISSVDLETWHSIRGGRGKDSFKCFMDAVGTMLILPAFSFYSVHCRDFKKERYIVNIENTGYNSSKGNKDKSSNDYNNSQSPYKWQTEQGYPASGYQGYSGNYSVNSYQGGYQNNNYNNNSNSYARRY